MLLSFNPTFNLYRNSDSFVIIQVLQYNNSDNSNFLSLLKEHHKLNHTLLETIYPEPKNNAHRVSVSQCLTFITAARKT